MNPPRIVSLRVNGVQRDVLAPANRLLVDTLRDELGLNGTKIGCGVGVCGACTVLLDGRTVSSCLLLTVMAEGAEITTVEGVTPTNGLHPVQAAFIDHGGLQCGACTPGQILAAMNLLEEEPSATPTQVADWMSGNLCRCTGYYGIVEAVLSRSRTGETGTDVKEAGTS